MRILKYKLNIQAIQSFVIPKNNKILCLKNQDDELTLWALVEEDGSESIINIYTFGTGQEIDHNKHMTYIDTVMIDKFVWHVFTDITTLVAFSRL